jgi:hypothetical protein
LHGTGGNQHGTTQENSCQFLHNTIAFLYDKPRFFAQTATPRNYCYTGVTFILAQVFSIHRNTYSITDKRHFVNNYSQHLFQAADHPEHAQQSHACYTP